MSKGMLLTLCMLAAACADKPTPITAPDFTIPIVVNQSGGDQEHGARQNRHWFARMHGSEEVPPRITPASGYATFHVRRDGETVDYKLYVFDITNVRQSHIHIGAPTVAGPVVVFLYGPVPAGGGPIEGQIAKGSFTSANFIGPLAGHPMADLLAAMKDGLAYVNVHTDDGVAPANTGPGDFPGGEIRGIIKARNAKHGDNHEHEGGDD